MIHTLFLFLLFVKETYSRLYDPYPYTIGQYSDSYKTYYVNATGTENIRCATPRSGCHTLVDTYSRVLGTRSTGSGQRTSAATIHFTNGTFEAESEPLTISRPITITGEVLFGVTGYTEDYDAAVLKVGPTSKSLITIDNTQDLIDVSVSSMTFSIDSAQKLTQPIFTVLKASKLTISYVLFNSTQPDSSLPAHSKSIIDASEGYIEMSHVWFRNITLASEPLLAVPKDIFFYIQDQSDISACHFENITRNSGDGGVFEVSFELKKEPDGTTLYNTQLPALYFTNCSVSSSNNGGAIYMRIDTLMTDWNPDFSELQFSGQGTASAGSYLFLATNVSNIAKKENYPEFSKETGATIYSTSLEDKTEGRANEVVLQEDKKDKVDLYLEERTIIIGGENAADDDCSTDAKPCTTFSAASKSASFSTAPVIWLAGHTIDSSKEEVSFGTLDRVVRPRLNTYPASIVLLESFSGTVFTVSSSVSMTYIDFQFKKPSDGKFAPVVFKTSGALVLSFVTFSPENVDDSISLQDSLISVASTGSVALSRCSISDLQFAKVVIDDASTSTSYRLSILQCSFTNLTLTESFLKTAQTNTYYSVQYSQFTEITLEDQSLFDVTYTDGRISDCVFTNITKKSGNGTIWSGELSTKNEATRLIWDCTFDNCTAKAGNGGAFYFNLLTTGTEELALKLSRGKFIKCVAGEDSSKAANTGFGGAIFVECSGLSTVTYTDAIEFSGEMNGKGKWLAAHLNTKEGVVFHNYSSLFPLIDDDDLVEVLGEDWEPLHLYPPLILINSTLLKTTGPKCLNASEEEKEAGYDYICPTLETADKFLSDCYSKHFSAKILYHNITYTSTIQELFPQFSTGYSLQYPRVINGSNDERTVLVVPSFHPTYSGAVITLDSELVYPYVTFKDLTFSLNITKGANWNPLSLFSVQSGLKLDNVTINTLATAITPFDDFTNVTSNTRTIYSPLDTSVMTVSKYLYLTNVLFENITLSNVPLLKLPQYSTYEPRFSENYIKLHETNKFKDITRNEGNGAVIEMTISRERYFILGNFTFENCKAANGNGGAVSFVLNWDSSLLFGNPETNKDLPIFKGCVADVSNDQSADEVAGYGGAVYLRLKGEPLPNGLRLNKIKASGGSAKSGRVLFAYGKYANLTKGGEYFKSVVSSSGNANDYLIGSYDQVEVPVETKNMANANGRKLWYQLWWVWLLVGLGILIIIAVIVVVIICCCCKKSS